MFVLIPEKVSCSSFVLLTQVFCPSQEIVFRKQNPEENILKKRLHVLQDQYLDNHAIC